MYLDIKEVSGWRSHFGVICMYMVFSTMRWDEITSRMSAERGEKYPRTKH